MSVTGTEVDVVVVDVVVDVVEVVVGEPGSVVVVDVVVDVGSVVVVVVVVGGADVEHAGTLGSKKGVPCKLPDVCPLL